MRSFIHRAVRTYARVSSRALHTTAAVHHAGCSTSASATTNGAIRMRAAVARSASGPLTIEPTLLRAPRSDEVLVRLVATGMCHTDVAVKERGLCSFPMILGHEGAGIVERVGNAVTQFKTGDAVLLSYASCDKCPHCLQGKPAYCFEHGSENFSGRDTGARAGIDAPTRHHAPNDAADPAVANEPMYGSFFRQSSFAEYALATENNMVKVDRDQDLAKLAPLGCGIQTGAGAVLNTLRPQVGSNLVVFGAGAVGLSSIMAARLAGCSRVVAVDRNPKRLELAKAMGATDVILATNTDKPNEFVDSLRGLSSRGFAYSIDTTGNPGVLRQAFDVLNPLGVCGLIGGAAPGVEVKIDMLGLLPGKQLRGIIQGDAVSKLFLPQLIEHHAAGRFPFEKMITYYDGLDKLNQAIADVKDANGTVVKPVIRIAH